jgi:light-regulated signal transduction histidine kinase (bacteriophytochrome)
MDDLSDQIKKQNATIHMGELPILEVDPVQFPKAIQNLISNALKYHRKGVFPIINITSSFLGKARKWQIEVSGNGIGIKEKYFDRIFKPFKRLHGRSEFEETGIGLAIGIME